MSPTTANVGAFIRDKRLARGLSQCALGERAGLSQSYIGMIECGKHVPRSGTRWELQLALRLTGEEYIRLMTLCEAAPVVRRGSPAWKAKLAGTCIQPGERLGRRYEFRRGNVPWNKGLKGIHLSPATEFKPGTLHGSAARNLKPIGTVTIRCDTDRTASTSAPRRRRYHWIKVRDDRLPQRDWIPLARYLYQKFTGPIPPGMFVVHADGDTLNDSLSNLMLMDRRRLFAWERSIRPQMEAKRRTRTAAAQHRRWAHYRAVQGARAANRRTG